MAAEGLYPRGRKRASKPANAHLLLPVDDPEVLHLRGRALQSPRTQTAALGRTPPAYVVLGVRVGSSRTRKARTRTAAWRPRTISFASCPLPPHQVPRSAVPATGVPRERAAAHATSPTEHCRRRSVKEDRGWAIFRIALWVRECEFVENASKPST